MKVFRFFYKCFIFLFIVGVLAIAGLYSYAYFSPKLDIKNANQVYIYDSSEQLVYQGSGNSEWVSLDEISPYLIDAVISTDRKSVV